MEALFLNLANMSITASWLVLAVIAVRLVFRKAPKWIHCLLWGLVAIRLVCPLSIESSFSLIPDTEPISQNVIRAEEPEKTFDEDIPFSPENTPAKLDVPAAKGEILDAEGNVIARRPGTAATVPEVAEPMGWTEILAWIWFAGAVLMLGYMLVSYLLLKKKVATAIPVRPGIKQSEAVDSPFVLGVIRPVIYLPFDMETEDMDYVIAHEAAHIRRRDHWWKPIGFTLLSIYWFNPLLWVAYILLCRDIEAACDERVIRNMDRQQRRAYSTALLNCSIHRRRIAACPLAFGEVGVKVRVKNVMSYRKPAFWLVLTGLVLVVTVSVCFLTDPRNSAPATMALIYLDRTQADVRFVYDEAYQQEAVQIGESYTLERLEAGEWKEIPLHSGKAASAEVTVVEASELDYDAWSLLRWESTYGTLPSGTYRIKKEITVTDDSGNEKTHSVYCEFSIGGTAESYITYTLEDVTPTGVKLYEHETVKDPAQLVYGGEGFWLEVLEDGQWRCLESGEGKRFVSALIYPSSHIQLDWSELHGELPPGTYRIAREITNTGSDDPRLCMAYAEFSVGTVITWFDRHSGDYRDEYPEKTEMELPGLEGVSASCDLGNNTISLVASWKKEPVIFSELSILNAFFTDLNSDGVWEICATVRGLETVEVQIYDPAQRKLYTLPFSENEFYVLARKADRLCVLEYDEFWNLQGYGQLAMVSGALEVREIDDAVKPLTERIVSVDVLTRKWVSISSYEELNRIVFLLQDLENKVRPATAEELAAAAQDEFYIFHITVNYGLGEKILHFSRDFSLIWEDGSEAGYRITDPEPLRQYVEALTDGVQDKQVSGVPFATADEPWTWCTGIRSSAVETAQFSACLANFSDGSTISSQGTSGYISYATLEELLEILNKLPRGAFTPDKLVSQEDYRSLFHQRLENNTAFSIIDGVNGIAVILQYSDGKVTMLLTDELDKARNLDRSYLEPTQLWEVRSPELLAFLKTAVDEIPLITYSVGAEYEWQAPLYLEEDGFLLALRLPQGWEYEQITNAADHGIRCRPEDASRGWLYFSYRKQEYTPQETDRYMDRNYINNTYVYTSWPADVKQPGYFSTEDKCWSYRRYDLEQGDFVIINQGADDWFAEYRDQIDDMITISNFYIS